ncbi:MAG: DUF6498-containing protein [Gammaproteobacteria bacterium]|jgi:hypothetical protein
MEYGNTLAQSAGINADRSVTRLLYSNLFTLVLAVWQGWEVSELLWIYWGQSVVIGWFNVQQILGLERFTTRGLRINNRPVAPTRATQRQVALLFGLHYGIFHFGYLVFLLDDAHIGNGVARVSVALCILVFYFNHRFSWHHYRVREAGRVPNLGHVMFFPYVRIIPMHLTILPGGVYAGSNGPALVLFLLLKTAADVAMHVIEHAMIQGARRTARRLP